MATAKKSAHSGFLKEVLKKLADSEFQIADSYFKAPPPHKYFLKFYREKFAIFAINTVDLSLK